MAPWQELEQRLVAHYCPVLWMSNFSDPVGLVFLGGGSKVGAKAGLRSWYPGLSSDLLPTMAGTPRCGGTTSAFSEDWNMPKPWPPSAAGWHVPRFGGAQACLPHPRVSQSCTEERISALCAGITFAASPNAQQGLGGGKTTP